MLYTGNKDAQVASLLVALEGFAEGYIHEGQSVSEVKIDSARIAQLIHAINTISFHKDGTDKASGFKKAAFFMVQCLLIQPIVAVEFEGELDQSYQFSHILKDYNPNAVFSLSLVIYLLNTMSISRDDGDCVIEDEIAITEHSYCDVLDALGSLEFVGNSAIGDAVLTSYYKLISLMLEQLFYKTNPSCQYSHFAFGSAAYLETIQPPKVDGQYD